MQPVQPENDVSIRWDDMPSLFQKRIRSGVITNFTHKNLQSFLNDARSFFQEKVKDALKDLTALKVNVELFAEFAILKNEIDSVEVKFFNTASRAIFESTNLEEWYGENVVDELKQQIEEFEGKGSGWSLRSVLSMIVNINYFQPMHHAGKSYIPLPKLIQSKDACLNVQNYDDRCFQWAILSALHPVDVNAEDVSEYKPYEHELNFSGVNFPVKLCQVKKFEKQNEVSLNIFILKKFGKKFEVRTAHLTGSYKPKHVNLLLIQNHYVDENKNNEVPFNAELKFHYVWIKNLSKLTRTQLSKHHGALHFCDRCLHYFYKEVELKNHIPTCMDMNTCRIDLPAEGPDAKVRFKNFVHKEKLPFCIYADIESILKPTDKMPAFQEHQAFSISYYMKNR